MADGGGHGGHNRLLRLYKRGGLVRVKGYIFSLFLYFLIFILIAEYFHYFDDLLIFSRIEFLHTILFYKNSTIVSYFEFYLMIILFICSLCTLIILLEIELTLYCLQLAFDCKITVFTCFIILKIKYHKTVENSTDIL